MTGRILDGRPVADSILADVARCVDGLRAHGRIPALRFVTIGDSPPAHIYASRLAKLSRRVGVEFAVASLPANVTLAQLDDVVQGLNADELIDGILVQMPLPDHLVDADISDLIAPRKDVDGTTVTNAGRLYLGRAGQRPPTALAMLRLLDVAGVCATGKHAVVIGRSNVVGHPVAELLLEQDATVTVTHRQTADLEAITRQADILMVGAGEPHLVRGNMVRDGVVVIDAGITVTEHGLVGDVAFDEVAPRASAITPVPGGVGPVTNAMLLSNLVESAEQAFE